MYKLYTDKNENFECKINLQGVSLNDSSARLILESTDWNLVFPGTINSDGKCNIPIKKLKLFNENTTGKLKLEVIADDVYFQPWTSDFIIETNKKAVVEVISQSDSKSNKPKISISEVKNNDDSIYLGFIKELKSNNITLRSLVNYKLNKGKIDGVIAKFINENKLSDKHKSKLLNAMVSYLTMTTKK
jgi:hypothetical protein